MTKVYVCPLGRIGVGAEDAVGGGWGHPLGAHGEAFAAVRIWLRRAGEVESVVLPVAELGRWTEAQPPDVAARLRDHLHRLATPPEPSPELPQGRPLIMGVINVTPDSFSDGGQFLDSNRAIDHGLRLADEGADLIDVGGESTRPGADTVPVEEELRRVLPVVKRLAAEGLLVSIDTRRAAVMAASIEAGARMINDISALGHDPASLDVAGASGLPVVLMHSRGEPATMQRDPAYDHVLLDVFDQLEGRIRTWCEAGFEARRLLIDPGIGFGKTLQHNLDLLRHLALYRTLGRPIALGVSRKSFIARLAGGAAPDARLPGSLAAGLAGVAQGIAMLRVHDVAATRQALSVWQASWA